ncbi:hypothetical protein HDU81_009928 [Chytriomyces hyalinus]|nr:hypothetical protein HDU81_009928 [Chytriomyces hyalinus]
MKSAEPLPETLFYDTKITCNALGHYFFVLPLPLDDALDQIERGPRGIYIDPGIKNFATGFDPDGQVVTWGKMDVVRIGRLLRYSGKLAQKIAVEKKKSCKKKAKRMQKALLRANLRIRNLVSEMHKKLCLYLVQNYTHVYIPRMNFHNFKKLSRVQKARMAAFRHCAFLDRLQNKTREYMRTKVYEVTEEYTSKTCTRCGVLDPNLRNKNVFDCKHCHTIVDRDMNGARNILLKTVCGWSTNTASGEHHGVPLDFASPAR